jgi:ubiquitin C-terminal hydrolase
MNISVTGEQLKKYYNANRVGLQNNGATCYINTLIQCLSTCFQFTHFILNKDQYADRVQHNLTKEKHQISLIMELATIFDHMWINENSLNPIRFLKTLQYKFDFLQINQQNDIEEIWLLMLNKMNEEILFTDAIHMFDQKILDSTYSSSSNQDDIMIKCYKAWYDGHNKEYSELIELLYGQMISQIICGNNSCATIHHNYEHFPIIQLEIPPMSTTPTIYDCLDSYIKEEILNEWKCDKCNTVNPSKKNNRFWKLPPVLVICLKRFIYHPEMQQNIKNNDLVDIPLELNMSNCVLSPQSYHKYQLQSAALHIGNINGGHYIALTRKSNDNHEQWYCIDDLKVTEYTRTQVGGLITNAYMLFYTIA